MKTEIKMEYLGGERKNTLKHDLAAMKMALISSLQSKDPSTQVGACIENNNRIISTGFNHNPFNWDSNEFPWRNDVSNIGEENTKYPYVIHAELDAISKCSDIKLLDGSTIYVTLFPCVQCSKLIVSFGIKRVIYGEYRDSIENECSRRLLEKCGVEVIQAQELKQEASIEKENTIVFRDMEYTELELAEFLCKFDLEHLDNTIGALTHFAGFSGDTIEVVSCLKMLRVHIHYEGGYKENKLTLHDIFNSFNKKELYLIKELADEAEMCSSIDDTNMEISTYFSRLSSMAENLLKSNQIKKNK